LLEASLILGYFLQSNILIHIQSIKFYIRIIVEFIFISSPILTSHPGVSFLYPVKAPLILWTTLVLKSPGRFNPFYFSIS